MGLFRKTMTFRVPAGLDGAGAWQVVAHSTRDGQFVDYTVEHDGVTLLEERREPDMSDIFRVETFALPDDLEVSVGYISNSKMASELRSADGAVLHRTSPKPYKTDGRFARLSAKIDSWDVDIDTEETDPTPEELEAQERQRALYPSMAVDFALGIVFFFVAREFGLVNAALAGAAVTIGLTVVDRFVKPDLLGGFAVFGVVMSLISAGFAILFQDDLAIKLKGAVIGIIAAVFALADARFNGGNYLGERMSRYMEGLFGRLDYRRAAYAMAGFGFALIVIETPLAFVLTTDQWIWYNSFLGRFISLPLFFFAMWLAKPRTREPVS